MWEAVTLRTLLIIAGFVAILSLGLVAARVAASSVSCAAGESQLVYPVYDRKGIAIHSVTKCGAAHRGCTLRAGTDASPVFDCSPFMAPKGTLSLQ